jgi:hypothetical protein
MKRACLLFLSLVVFFIGVTGFAQDAGTPKPQHVAVLTSDASATETQLIVDTSTGIVVDKDLIIESRDGKVKETVVVEHVYGSSLVLKARLKNSFLSGSKLYQ